MTKEAELCVLLDAVFDAYPSQPDFAYIRELAYQSQYSSWLISELLRAMYLYNEDPSAFDEYLWSVTGAAK